MVVIIPKTRTRAKGGGITVTDVLSVRIPNEKEVELIKKFYLYPFADNLEKNYTWM